jgi:serine/threonine protein kinase
MAPRQAPNQCAARDRPFDQEASILARLTHPAIVRYVAHGIAEGGQRYIAMEWLDGEDLCTRLERQAVTAVQTVAIARRACEALAHAHAQSIVHRDVKPENLFLPAGHRPPQGADSASPAPTHGAS